jgi:hypothetical protein
MLQAGEYNLPPEWRVQPAADESRKRFCYLKSRRGSGPPLEKKYEKQFT